MRCVLRPASKHLKMSMIFCGVWCVEACSASGRGSMNLGARTRADSDIILRELFEAYDMCDKVTNVNEASIDPSDYVQSAMDAQGRKVFFIEDLIGIQKQILNKYKVEEEDGD